MSPDDKNKNIEKKYMTNNQMDGIRSMEANKKGIGRNSLLEKAKLWKMRERLMRNTFEIGTDEKYMY